MSRKKCIKFYHFFKAKMLPEGNFPLCITQYVPGLDLQKIKQIFLLVVRIRFANKVSSNYCTWEISAILVEDE